MSTNQWRPSDLILSYFRVVQPAALSCQIFLMARFISSEARNERQTQSDPVSSFKPILCSHKSKQLEFSEILLIRLCNAQSWIWPQICDWDFPDLLTFHTICTVLLWFLSGELGIGATYKNHIKSSNLEIQLRIINTIHVTIIFNRNHSKSSISNNATKIVLINNGIRTSITIREMTLRYPMVLNIIIILTVTMSRMMTIIMMISMRVLVVVMWVMMIWWRGQ